ncbi:recombinase family protein [Anaerophilus nitritogenes]|uniref:recombinase family protein n=1 Tax=Anaerophilus nitritogenes TaxID=2498136 RepID=UPI00101D329B|nr:recombinase family protein [Anaerophilus nitritogenes]
MKIGVGYIRMSTDKQQESPKVQKDIIEEYAEQNNIKILKWYEDLGISGGSLKNREGMMELIFDAEKKLFDMVISFKLDRIFRNIEEQSVILSKFDDLGIKFIGIKDPEGEGASGRLIRNILGAINQFERELTGERIFYSNRHIAKQGLWPGGVLPLGYDLNSETKTLIINKEESRLVNLIKDLYFKYRSCYKVAQELNNMGYMTKQGRKFSGVAISIILRNPTYMGNLRWNLKGKDQDKMEIFEGQHKPIWSQEEYNEIQRILDSNVNNQYGNKRSYLLSGILICGDCGYKLRPRMTGKKSYYYKCVSGDEFGKDFCKNNCSINTKLIHPIVIKKLKQNITNANLSYDKPILDNSNSMDIESEIKRLESLIDKYKNLYLMDMISSDELKENVSNYKTQIQVLQQTNSKNDNIDDTIIDLLINFNGIYEDSNNIEKKDLVNSLIQEIIIYDKFNYLISYKNLGIAGWKSQDKINIKTNKKSIREQEIERIVKELE